jgi:hypothetical protein
MSRQSAATHISTSARTRSAAATPVDKHIRRREGTSAEQHTAQSALFDKYTQYTQYTQETLNK